MNFQKVVSTEQEKLAQIYDNFKEHLTDIPEVEGVLQSIADTQDLISSLLKISRPY